MPRPALRPAILVALLAGCAVDPARRAAVPSPAASVPARPRPAPALILQRPAWTARKVVADARAVPGGRLHIVKPGETGIAIARAYGADWSKVAAANRLKPPYTIDVGDRLLLPSAVQVATMSIEERARAFTLDIDDIITGGEPAVTPPSSGAPGPLPPTRTRPGATQPARPASSLAALPALTGNTPRFTWPVEGRILSSFGAKSGGRFNDGVNLKATPGAPVRAAGDGVVAYAGDAIAGFGNLVLVKHAGGYVTAYAHNEALLVARGKRLAQGDILARAGATGAVDEPQVHFEIRRNRTPVDPAKLIGGR